MWPLKNKFRPFTPLRQVVGVEALRESLRGSLEGNKKLRKLFDERSVTLLEPMSRSPMEYLDEIFEAVEEYYDGLKRGPNIKNMYLPPSDSRLSTVIKIHNETSEVFKLVEKRVGIPIDNDLSRSGETIRPFLLDLVGAHVTMAVRHGADANNNTEKQDPSANESHEIESFAVRRMRAIRKLADLFAEDIEIGKSRVVGKNLRHRGFTRDQLEPIEVTALWWVLVLRGVCWWITVQLKLPEVSVPSYSYYSQMAVYIT